MDKDEVQLLLDQARITLNKGRFKEANKFLDKILGAESHNDQALNLKGLVLFKEDRYAEAVGIFRTLLSMFPSEPTLLTNLGLALLKSEQYVEAEGELRRALDLGGNAEKINNYLGLVMSGLGRYKEAQQHFDHAGSKKMADQMLALMGAADPAPAKSAAAKPAPAPVAPPPPPAPPKAAPASKPAPAAPTKVILAEPDESDAAADDVALALEASSTTVPPPAPKVKAPAPAPAPVAEPDDDDSIIEGDARASAPLPGLQNLGNKDVLSVALHALQERFSSVVETSNFGENLQKLSEILSVRKKPDDELEFPMPSVARVNVGPDPVYARSSLIVSATGGLTSAQQNKKYKGRELSTPFGSAEDPIQRVEGKGLIVLECGQGHRFHTIPIEEELIYLVEGAVAAFMGEIRFDNGRLPADDGYDLDLVQFRGSGRILVVSQKRLLAVPVAANDVSLFRYEQVLGWFGNTVPTLATTRAPFANTTPKLVSFKGEGVVLMSVNTPQ